MLRQFYWVGLNSFFASYFIFAFLVHVIRDRYLSHLIVFVLPLFVASIHRLTYGRSKLVSFFLPLLICIPYWLPQLDTLRKQSDACVYQAIQPILFAYKSNDLIVNVWEVFTPEFTRELPANFNFVSFPDTARVNYVNFNGLSNRVRDEKNYCCIQKIMQKTLTNGGRIWFIEPYLNNEAMNERPSSQIFKDDDFAIAELLAARRLSQWLLANAVISKNSVLFLSTTVRW